MYHVTIEEIDEMRIKAENEAIKYARHTDNLREKVKELEEELQFTIIRKNEDHLILEKAYQKIWREYFEMYKAISKEVLVSLPKEIQDRIQNRWAPKQPG